jgi:hypothetical protein
MEQITTDASTPQESAQDSTIQQETTLHSSTHDSSTPKPNAQDPTTQKGSTEVYATSHETTVLVSSFYNLIIVSIQNLFFRQQ